jgi:membrane-bound acyltransferase YfiQ involved in biofilm formation
MSSFALYLIGAVILIGGVAWALVAAGVPTLYVVIASIILIGYGIMRAVGRTRPKDLPK